MMLRYQVFASEVTNMMVIILKIVHGFYFTQYIFDINSLNI